MIAIRTLKRLCRQASVMLALAGSAAVAQAQQGNAIESITANQQGSNVIVKIAMKETPQSCRLALPSPIRPVSRSISGRPPMPPARPART